MSRYSSFGGSSSNFMNNKSQMQNQQNQQQQQQYNTGKLMCEIHPTQKVKAICLKDKCDQPSRFVCFQCMTSNHTQDSKYFVSLKEIKALKQKDDVFQVYNYPTELLDDKAYDWIRNYSDRLNKNEQDVENFYNDLKQQICKQLDKHKDHVLESIFMKKEAVEKHVQNIKQKVNSTFSLQPLQSFIGEFTSGHSNISKFNADVTTFLNDEKKVQVRENIQGDIQSMVNLFNYGFLRPDLEEAIQIKNKLLLDIDLLQSKLLSPVNISYVDGDIEFGNDSKFITTGNSQSNKNTIFKFNLPEDLNLQERNTAKIRLRLQDLNEDPNLFAVNLGVHSAADSGTQEDTGNYITMAPIISSKVKGDFDQKKWNSLQKLFKEGVIFDIEINLKKSQFQVFQLTKDMHSIQIFKQNEYFELDKDQWTFCIFSKPENKFQLELLESHLID